MHFTVGNSLDPFRVWKIHNMRLMARNSLDPFGDRKFTTCIWRGEIERKKIQWEFFKCHRGWRQAGRALDGEGSDARRGRWWRCEFVCHHFRQRKKNDWGYYVSNTMVTKEELKQFVLINGFPKYRINRDGKIYNTEKGRSCECYCTSISVVTTLKPPK